MLLFIKLLGILKGVLVLFFVFLKQFYVSREIEKGQRYPKYPLLHICTAAPIVNILHQMVHLLQLTDHVTHIPQLLLEFTLGVVLSMGLDKHIHHYRIIQSIFIGMKILCAQPIPPMSPNPWNPYRFHSFAFSKISSRKLHSM